MSPFETEDDSGVIEVDFKEFLYPKKRAESVDFVKGYTTPKNLKKQMKKLEEVFE